MKSNNIIYNPTNKSSSGKPSSHVFQTIMILYLVVWSISPPMDIDNIYRIIALFCIVGWFFLDMLNGLQLKRIHLLALGFLLMVIVINIIQFEGFSKVLKPMSSYILVLAFIINYSYQGRWSELHIIIPVFLGLLIVFNIITYRELSIDPTLARRIVRADESIYPYMRKGVGGFALEHTQVFLFPLIVSWIIESFKKHKWFFLLGIVWLVSYLLLILNSGYSIALVTTIASLVVLLFYRGHSIIPPLIITISIVVLLVVLIGYVDSVRESLLGFFDGTKVARKIEDIYSSIHGTEVADSIQSRINRYYYSIQTIVQYPLIGGLWFQAGGGHSAIMDSFAQYGIFGGILFIKIFYCVPRKIKKEATSIKEIRIANAFLVSLIVVTLLDGMPYNMIFPVLIVAPIFFEDIQKWSKEKADLESNLATSI